MKQFASGSPSPSLHPWTQSDRANTKTGGLNRLVWGRSQLLLNPGQVRNEVWNWGDQHLKQPCPPSRGRSFKQLSYDAIKMPVSKGGPSYFTFVSSARLWDRGLSQDRPTLQPDSTRPSLPCPRFIAHMNTSSGTLQSPWGPNPRPRALQAGPSNAEPLASPRDVLKTAVFPGHGVAARLTYLSSFKPRTKALPKSPQPSEASLDEDEEKQEDVQRETGLVTGEQNPAEDLEAKGESGSSKMFWSDPDLGDPEMDEVDRLRESISPLLSEMDGTLSDCSTHTWSVGSQGTEFGLDRNTDQTEMWDRLSSLSRTGGGSSTDLSQLRCSSLTWSSRDSEDSELKADSSVSLSDRVRLHNSTPLVASSLYQSMVNADLSASGCHGVADPFQISPPAVKGSSSETSPSFIEIWHGRVLERWPILPPISPQRGPSDASLCESPWRTAHSYSGLSAYEELDGIIPCTGSSLHHHTLDDTGGEASDSELSERSSASHTPWTSMAQKSLAEIRLSLMDHQSWDHHRDIDQLEESLAQTSIAERWERISKGETEEMERSGKIKNNGFPIHRISGISSERKSKAAQRNNEEDKHRNGYTTTATLNGSFLSARDANHRNSAPVAPPLTETAHPEGVGHSASTDSSNLEGKLPPFPSVDPVDPEEDWRREEIQLTKTIEVQKASDRVGSVDGDTQINEEIYSVSSCHVESEKITEAPQTSQIQRQRPPKLNHGVLMEMERMRQAQERKAKALSTFEKLRATKPSGEQGSENKNASNFEDFRFLEKYCIFNREELALYKKRFEEVDNDNDGHLSCVEVVMGLKEIVPSGALTDSEEIYIYRILETVDYHVTDGLTDFRLFAVMASLAQKITALDGFTRSLIGNMDFKALELRIYRAKQLFLCNMDPESNTISVQQFLVELKAGGISRVHEEEVRKELRHTKALDLLDFLTYLPLFVLIHNSVVSNPLDDSRAL
ncbi:uncharacterized protein [Heptranchias perlo]|uniref:uncharacterized protein isoform X2 n=1 Tax=Heptranchias perlo TaxID=212740 RepID=UPI003559ACFF